MVNIEGLTINKIDINNDFVLEILAQAHITIINNDALRAVEAKVMEMLE